MRVNKEMIWGIVFTSMIHKSTYSLPRHPDLFVNIKVKAHLRHLASFPVLSVKDD